MNLTVRQMRCLRPAILGAAGGVGLVQVVLTIEMLALQADLHAAAWASALLAFPCLVLVTWGLAKSGTIPLVGLIGEFAVIVFKAGFFPWAECCRNIELAEMLGVWAVHVGLLAGVFMFRRHGGLI